MNVEYITTAYNKSQFPKDNLPEIAFVGRSNVGKSSLINCLTNRKKLAYVSNTPGKTKVINYFVIDKKIYFVDLPGYGFAKVPFEVKKHWRDLIELYLSENKNLKLVILIIDIRHKPSEDDLLMKQWLDEYNVSTIIVANKKDKLSNNEKAQSLAQIKKSFNDNDIEILPFSGKTGDGKSELWERINQG
ncbi:YihA family ribosome biogenesis GTP-binding protein [Candidatus Poribacteria bacterium]|nr:YihA family ribosome biogenesis GTP-binding protein [Candidatus Poribacteria bacterium]